MPSRRALPNRTTEELLVRKPLRIRSVWVWLTGNRKVFAPPGVNPSWANWRDQVDGNSNSVAGESRAGAETQPRNTSFMQFAILATQQHEWAHRIASHGSSFFVHESLILATPLAAVVGFGLAFFIKSNFALSLAWPFNKFHQALHFQQFSGQHFSARLFYSHLCCCFAPFSSATFCALCWF